MALFIILAILGGQLADVFDRADRSSRVKNDPDYMLVVAAACVGFALLVSKATLALSRHPFARTNNSQPEVPSAFPWTLAPEPSLSGPSPPSLSLRI